MATELVGGIVFYPPKPRHDAMGDSPLREELPPIYTAYLRVSMPAPNNSTQNTRILSPLSLPIGL